MSSDPKRIPILTAAVTLGLTLATAVVVLAFFGKISLAPGGPGGAGRVFYVVPYHYGFAFYDARFKEIERIRVKEGETVTLRIVSASALAGETFLEYSERALARPIGGLPAGDPRIRKKILEDATLGNIEHIIGISSHPVYVATAVTPMLDGKPFREGGPRTLQDAVRTRDPSIKTITFTAKTVGAFDVLCVDSGMDGSGTCGWGHKWMVAREAFVVER